MTISPARRSDTARDAVDQDSYQPQPAARGRVDLGLAVVVLGGVAFVLAFIPIVRYLGFLFAVVAVVLGLVNWRRARRWRHPMSAYAKRGLALSVACIAVVVYTVTVTVLEERDDRVKASGTATQAVLAEDMDADLGEFVFTTDDLGATTKGMPIEVKNTSGERKSFEFQVQAIGAGGERLATQLITIRGMRDGEKRQLSAFQYIDDTTAEQLVDDGVTFDIDYAVSF